MTGYWDIVTVLGIATLMLLVLDWRINRAFTRHEKVEQTNFAVVALASDTAAALSREASKHLREVQTDVAVTKAKVTDLSEEVKMHASRLGAVEERLMRAALMVPHIHRREGDPP